jgi:hypothetical protein
MQQSAWKGYSRKVASSILDTEGSNRPRGVGFPAPETNRTLCAYPSDSGPRNRYGDLFELGPGSFGISAFILPLAAP